MNPQDEIPLDQEMPYHEAISALNRQMRLNTNLRGENQRKAQLIAEQNAQIVELRVRLSDNERWAATLQSNLNTAIAVGHAEQRKVRALLDLLTPDQIKAAFLAMLEDL